MQELKAMELLQALADDKEDSNFKEKYEIKTELDLRDFVKEAINEFEQYEQNFKQKEFDYRTECQNLVSTGRVEADNMPDRLAELEKVMEDYYLNNGYRRGDFCFLVSIESEFKFKTITTYLRTKEGGPIEKFTAVKTEEMWDKAIKYFSLKTNLLQDDGYAKGGFTNGKFEVAEDTLQICKEIETHNFYKAIGYESDGTE